MRMIPRVDPLDDWDNLPESHALIGYENLLDTASGATPPNVLIPNTFERWRDSSGTMTAVFGTGVPVTIDYVAIGAHNLFTAGVTQIEISYATVVSGPYTLIQSVAPQDNEAFMINFPSIENVVELRVFVPSDGSTDREIGIIYAGRALRMYQPIYGGHSPMLLSAETEFQSPRSETGQFLALNKIRKGLQGNFSWKNLDPKWYRERFQPFVKAAESAPFFINWRPDRYNEVALCHIEDDVIPTNAGGGSSLMNVSMKVRGHSDSRS